MEGRAAEPLLSLFSPGAHLGAVSDSFAAAVQAYAAEDPDGLLSSSRLGSSASSRAVSSEKFSALMSLHYLYSLVPAGESVGVLAAQSIGEPSTQMTLNTFHLAGHGGGNVTLGIPRLREIVMTASASIRTPIMRLPLLDPAASRQRAEDVAARLTRLNLRDFISAASVTESVETSNAGAAFRLDTVRLLLPPLDSAAVVEARLSYADFQHCIVHQFAVRLNAAVKKEVRGLQSRHAVSPVVLAVHKAAASKGLSADGCDEAETSSRMRRRRGGEDDAVTAKERSKRHESASYDEPDDDERWIIDAERRSGHAQLGDEDDDDDLQPKAEQQQEDEQVQEEEEEVADATAASSSSSPDWLSGVLSRCPFLRSISFDTKREWASVVVSVSLSLPKLLMMSLVEAAVDGCLLRSTPGISRAFVVEQKQQPQPASAAPSPVSSFAVATDGVNFRELLLYSDCLALDRLYSNDVAALLRHYGVEAARTAITREIQAVFSPYGISVDYRHLSLLADYMTVSGEFRPLNRSGLSSSTSAFQKMTFETSIHFLREAALLSDTDSLQSPSSRIVVGEPVGCGTGAFDLMQPIIAMTQQSQLSM